MGVGGARGCRCLFQVSGNVFVVPSAMVLLSPQYRRSFANRVQFESASPEFCHMEMATPARSLSVRCGDGGDGRYP